MKRIIIAKRAIGAISLILMIAFMTATAGEKRSTSSLTAGAVDATRINLSEVKIIPTEIVETSETNETYEIETETYEIEEKTYETEEKVSETDILSEEPKAAVQTEEKAAVQEQPRAAVLNKRDGVNYFNGQKETYYNLKMSGVIRLMEDLGYYSDYWVRADGVKMYGDYIMCAADTNRLPKGTIIETSLGTAMVCDHCGSAESYSGIWLDIAVTW